MFQELNVFLVVQLIFLLHNDFVEKQRNDGIGGASK